MSDNDLYKHFEYPVILTWPLGLIVYALCLEKEKGSTHIGTEIIALVTAFNDWLHVSSFSGYDNQNPEEIVNHLIRLETLENAITKEGSLFLKGMSEDLFYQRPWLELIVQKVDCTSEESGYCDYNEPVNNALNRLFLARDQGQRFQPACLEYKSLTHYQVTQFLDHILEEVESICLSIGTESFSGLKQQVDTAQRFFHQGMDILQETIRLAEDEENKANIDQALTPILANIQAFLESFDNVLNAFGENPENACDTSLALITLYEFFAGHRTKGTAWYNELAAIRAVLNPGPSDSRQKKQIDYRRSLTDLRMNRVPSFSGDQFPLNSLVAYRQLQPWLCLGPRILAGLSLTCAQEAISNRRLGWAGQLLYMFHPPKMNVSESICPISKWQEIGKRGFRWLSSGVCWLLLAVFYLPCLIPWTIDILNIPTQVISWQPASGNSGIFPLLFVCVTSIIMAGGLPILINHKIKNDWKGCLQWWQNISNRMHLNLILPQFLFNAGFGTAIAVTNEFDFHIWLSHLYPIWWQVALLILALCLLGCFTQIKADSIKSRIAASIRNLGCYALLAHIPAIILIWVMFPALLKQNDGFLPGVVSLYGWGHISLYCVFFTALTGMLVGIVGETFLSRS